MDLPKLARWARKQLKIKTLDLSAGKQGTLFLIATLANSIDLERIEKAGQLPKGTNPEITFKVLAWALRISDIGLDETQNGNGAEITCFSPQILVFDKVKEEVQLNVDRIIITNW